MTPKLPLNKVTEVVRTLADSESGNVVCVINRTGLDRDKVIQRLEAALQGAAAEVFHGDDLSKTDPRYNSDAVTAAVTRRREEKIDTVAVFVVEPEYRVLDFVSNRVVWIEAA